MFKELSFVKSGPVLRRKIRKGKFSRYQPKGIAMKSKCETNAVITQIVEANSPHLTLRERHLLRESLHSLVRLAKSELLMEIRSNAQKLTGVVAQSPRRHRVANDHATSPLQQHFEFTQFD